MRRTKKHIHGVLLLDKPLEMSSNAAVQRVKWLYQAKKAGHTGALDPLATGLLPICFGQATKVSEYLLGSDKKYTAVIKLGEVTDTRDAEGDVIARSDVCVTDDQIQRSLDQFRGNIKQVPPMYSALKKNGQPLYKMARSGENIELAPRDMTVFSLEAERIEKDRVRLDVHCSSGFYIRSLGHDIGQVLGCGAHVIELRRTHIKSISHESAIRLNTLAELEGEQEKLNELLLPIDTLISHIPKIEISKKQIESLLCGKPTSADGLEVTDLSRFYSDDGRLFGLGQVLENGLVKTQKIFMDLK